MGKIAVSMKFKDLLATSEDSFIKLEDITSLRKASEVQKSGLDLVL